MSISYQVSICDADAHLIDVQLDIESPAVEGQRLTLPNWIPGSYMIRDFSRNIIAIEASCGEQAVQLKKQDKSSWLAPAGLDQLTVRYRVYAWDLSVRAAHVDRSHAFFNGTSVFLSVCEQQWQTHRVVLHRPAHDTAEVFQVATTLTPVQIDSDGYGEYRAADYDELIDHPVEQGSFKRLSFSACGVPHDIVFSGECYFDEARVVSDLTRICEQQIRFFGEPAPFDRYVFLTTVVDSGYGGLEHRSSTALMITRESLPVRGKTDTSDKYLDFLGLCSHEYFHNWNVKRIKPARFVPYELAAESYTEMLWFFEGITSYYDDLMLVRCGLIDHERYLALLARTLTRVQRGAGRLIQSVAESSFDAWHKFYKQDENAPNAIVSYYTKGALIALCLDSLMRKSSVGTQSLDTLMKTLWAQWLNNPAGLSETEPQRIAERLLDKDLSSFFQPALYGTEALPLVESLAELGVKLSWRARRSASDTGTVGAVESDDGAVDDRPWSGALFSSAPTGVRVTHVMTGSPAEEAGLSPGDTLVAINALAVTTDTLPSMLERYQSAGDVRIHYFRLGVLNESRLTLRSAPEDTATLDIADSEAVAQWLDDNRALQVKAYVLEDDAAPE